MKTPLSTLLSERRHRGPSAFGVHVVDGDGRNASEVVNTKIEKSRRIVTEIRRRLKMNVVGQEQARSGDGPVKLFVARWW